MGGNARDEGRAARIFLWRVLLVSGPRLLYKKGHTFSLRCHPTPVFSVNNKFAPLSTSAFFFCLFLTLR
jgi:hypothetical protein